MLEKFFNDDVPVRLNQEFVLWAFDSQFTHQHSNDGP
jgi:hypothetical protein